MKNITIVGILEERPNGFIVKTELGTEFKLYAIRPMEAVSPDFDIGKYAAFVGKKVRASGMCDGNEIYSATVEEI